MNICVFSSSSNTIDSLFFEEANNLGTLLGKNNFTLINGGAKVGLMEATTVAANKAGTKTIGIIPEKLKKRDLSSNNSCEIIITKNMQDRKAKMRQISDAFIALPGGFGTLEEILEVLTLKHLSYHNKPIVFINTNNYFEHLFKQFEVSVDNFFAKKTSTDYYFVANNSYEAIEYIKSYQSVELNADNLKYQ